MKSLQYFLIVFMTLMAGGKTEESTFDPVDHARRLIAMSEQGDVYFADEAKCGSFYRAFLLFGYMRLYHFYCPVNMQWSNAARTCVRGDCERQGGPPKNTCVKLEFKGTFGSEDVLVGHVNANLRNNNLVCLSKGGFLNIPKLNNMQLGDKLFVLVKTYQIKLPAANATLLTNSDDAASSSFLLRLADGNYTVTMVTDAGVFTATCQASYRAVSVTYSGSELKIRSNNQTETIVPATGVIQRRPHDMNVGRGLEGCIVRVVVCPNRDRP